MKIVIVGPGAMGLLFSAFLSQTKEDIWVLDKNSERCQKLKNNGFKVSGLSSFHVQNVKFSSDVKEVKDAQIWMICTKSYHTKDVIKNIIKSVASCASVMSLQNGIGNMELLSEEFGPERVLVGVTNMAAVLDKEDSLRHTGVGETVLGCACGNMSVVLKDLRGLFQKAGISVKISKDVKSFLWTKLVINAGINALSVLTRLKNGSLTQHEGSRKVFVDAVTEAVKVAKRKKIKLVYDDMQAKAESVCQSTAENYSSMLEDVLHQRKTEIDFINGAIVRQGKSLGIKTPANYFLFNLVKTIEESYPCQIQKNDFLISEQMR